MDIETIKLGIAKDIAKIQHNSDILSQWPISSVEAMYYSGPFFMKLFIGDVLSSGESTDSLFSKKLYAGKLSNLVFYFLNEKVKEMMGDEKYSNTLNLIISKISILRGSDPLLKNKGATVMPNWSVEKESDEVSSKTIVFLLDNLTEMVNPIFRSFGFQLFFDENYVYRYYYRTGLDFNIVVKSPKGEMEVDYFEHVIVPENLDSSKIYIEADGKLNATDLTELNNKITEKIRQLKSSSVFDRKYVIEQIYSAFGHEAPKEQIGFLDSPFPEVIKEAYVKTCSIPLEFLEKGIFNLIK